MYQGPNRFRCGVMLPFERGSPKINMSGLGMIAICPDGSGVHTPYECEIT